MEEVKRWNGFSVMPQEDGYYVAYTDYAALKARVAELEGHIETLTDLDKFDLAASKMGVSGVVQGAGAALMASIMAKPLLDMEAPNYVECRFTVTPKGKAPIELTYTVQRVTGKTPHEKRVEAEAKRDSLRAQLEAAKREADGLRETAARMYDDLCALKDKAQLTAQQDGVRLREAADEMFRTAVCRNAGTDPFTGQSFLECGACPLCKARAAYKQALAAPAPAPDEVK